MSQTGSQKNISRSIAVVAAGFLAIFILSIGTDVALAAAGIFPPLDQPVRFTNPLWLLATAYRSVYSVAGCYLAARLAPARPMKRALVLGFIGFIVSIAGAIVMRGHGPAWYPIALVVLAMPCAWLGGVLYSPKPSAAQS